MRVKAVCFFTSPGPAVCVARALHTLITAQTLSCHVNLIHEEWPPSPHPASPSWRRGGGGCAGSLQSPKIA